MLALDAVHTIEAREGLRQLGDDSIDCVLTSPAYWAQRDYKLTPSTWADRWVGALGLEPHFQKYLDHLLEVFDEVYRVLKPSGTLWVNLGDCYAGPWSIGPARGGHAGRHAESGLAPGWNHHANPRHNSGAPVALSVRHKSLCLVPERFAVRMVERGWILRNVIVWHKPNFLPASVKDRFACSHERLLFFTKSERYSFDLDAVRVPHVSGHRAERAPHRRFRPSPHPAGGRLPPKVGHPKALHPLGKNPGDCWSIATRPSFGDHPAVFPEALCERPILAGCPAGGIVLDPFAGSGTTCVVARRLGRRYMGFEASPDYADVARLRLKVKEEETASAPDAARRAA